MDYESGESMERMEEVPLKELSDAKLENWKILTTTQPSYMKVGWL